MDKNEFTKMNNEIIFLENMKQKKRSDMFSYEFRSCLFVFSLLLLMINPRSPLPDWGVIGGLGSPVHPYLDTVRKRIL